MCRKVFTFAPLLLMLAMVACGCTAAKSGSHAENGQEITETRPPASQPLIVQIVGRDSTITVRAGPRAATYSVSDAKGNTSAPPAQLEQLRASDPGLARRIESMDASSASFWAGVE